MERDEATQTAEDEGRATPRWYRYVFVRDTYNPTWFQTSSSSAWWGGSFFYNFLLFFGIFCVFWVLLGWLYWGNRD